MKKILFIPLLLCVGTLTASVSQDDVRSMRYSHLKRQHQHNQARIEKLKKDLRLQNAALDQEISELKETVLLQEKTILELMEKLKEANN